MVKTSGEYRRDEKERGGEGRSENLFKDPPSEIAPLHSFSLPPFFARSHGLSSFVFLASLPLRALCPPRRFLPSSSSSSYSLFSPSLFLSSTYVCLCFTLSHIVLSPIRWHGNVGWSDERRILMRVFTRADVYFCPYF